MRSAVFAATLLLTGIAHADEAGEADKCATAAEQAQSLRKEGKLHKARDNLMVCSRSSCPTFIQKDCTTWLGEIDKDLPSIVVRATDANGKDVSNVKVSIDGKPVADKLDGRPLQIDPGEHKLTFELAGTAPVTEMMLIRQAETNRMVSVSFKKDGATIDKSGQSSPSSGGIPMATWVLGGAGIVLAGVGGGLWLAGTGDHSDMESGCARTRSCLQDDVDSAQTKLLIGDIAFGAGLVAIGAAIVLAVISKPDQPQPHSPKTARSFLAAPWNGSRTSSVR